MERKIRRQRRFSGSGIYRAALLASTALPALLAGPAAFAQTLAPDTTPQGGSVVGGTASISQGVASSTITQSSQNTAINWQSFNVGSSAKVQFIQPNSSAIALNRVVSATPSLIAGQINANGQLVLINQSGVVFAKGSQVNAQAIVVSTSDIDTKDFMAGRMNFTGSPNPGAKIINDGQLTARQAGLVGLVAPQVLNEGVITASLGVVQLAAGSAFVLDLYGDRLISINVTQAVRAVDVGGKTLPALVTNHGLIVANGGKIVLTAADADALVTQLIDAGGTLQADSVGSQTGAISLQGIGGNISIAGNLLARGTAAGGKGGSIEAVTDGAVTASSSAILDASGAAGGGVVALGTDIARAEQGQADVAAPRAASVTVVAGAVVKADATSLGNAGTVTLLSAQNTDFAGAILVQGGPQGGNGGLAEISSGGVISLSGTVADIAINGQAGEVLLDPATLVVGNAGTVTQTGTSTTIGLGTTGTTTISASSLDTLSGTVALEASSFISIASQISSTSIGDLSLVSGGSIDIAAAIVLGSLNASLEMDAAGAVDISAPVKVGPGGTPGAVTITDSAGGVTETASGLISAGMLTTGAGSIVGSADFDSTINAIGTLGTFSLSSGNLTLDDGVALAIDGAVTLPGVFTLTDTAPGGVTEGTTGAISLGSAGVLTTGTASIDGTTDLGGTNNISTLGAFSLSSGNLTLNDTVALAIDSAVTVPGVFTLTNTGGGVTEGTTGAISLGSAGVLTTGTASIDGTTDLGGTNNIGTLGAFSLRSGNLTLNDTVALAIDDVVAVPGVFTLTDTGGGVTEATTGAISLGSAGILTTGTASIDGTTDLGSTNNIGALNAFSLSSGNLTLNDTVALAIDGTVTVPGKTALPGVFTLTDIGGGVTEATTGAISLGSAGILTTGTASIDGTTDLGGTNNIGAMNAFSLSSGNLTLNDTVALAIDDVVTVPGVFTLTDTGGGVTEATTGAISLGSAGILTTGTASIDGTTDLGGTNNIGALNAFSLSSGNLTLNDTVALAIDGAVTVPHLFTLIDIGGVTETTGSIIGGGTLTTGAGSIVGSADFGSSLNSIGTLINFTATGDIDLVDNVSLLTATDVQGGNATPFYNVDITNRNNLTVDGITASSDVVLDAVQADLNANDVFAGEDALLSAGDDITASNIYGFHAIQFSAGIGTIQLAQEISTSGTIIVNAGSDVMQAGGTIEAVTLTTGAGSIAGNVDFGSNLNAIGTLEVFNVGTHGFVLIDSTSLDTEGTLIAKTATLAARTLNLDGTLNVPTLVALAADTLTGTLAGDLTTLDIAPFSVKAITLGGTSLEDTLHNALDLSGTTFFDTLSKLTFVELGQASTYTANSIISENNFSFSVTTLTVALEPIFGITAVDDSTLSANYLTLAGTSFELDGTIANIATLSLAAIGTVTQPGTGIIDATLVSGSVVGMASLAGTLNNIQTLANFTVTGPAGDLLLNDAAPLTISGSVDVPGTMAALGNITLTDSGTVLELPDQGINTGTLSTGIFTASNGATIIGIGDDASLIGSGNSIGALGNFTVTGSTVTEPTFALTNDISMSITGLVQVGNDGTGKIVLASDNTLQEVGTGLIDAGTVTTNGALINGDAIFSDANNAIYTLTAFNAAGNIALNDDLTALTATDISGADVDIFNTGGLDAGGIGGGPVELGAGGDLAANGVNSSSTAALTAGDNIDNAIDIDAGTTAQLTAILGSITATNINAGTLAQLTAGTDITANGIFAGTDFTHNGSFVIDGVADLNAGGSIDATNVTAGSTAELIAGTDITANSIFAGANTAGNGTFFSSGSAELNAGGSINANTIFAGTTAQLVAGTDINADLIIANTGSAELNAGGSIAATTISAGTSAELSAGNDITADHINGGGVVLVAARDLNASIVTASGAALLTASDDIIANDIHAATTVTLNAGTNINANLIIASADSAALKAVGSIAASAISAGTSAQLTAGTNITATNISAGTTAQLVAGNDITLADDIHARTAALHATGDITATSVFGTIAADLSAGQNITADNINGFSIDLDAGHDLNASILTAGGAALLTATSNDILANDIHAGTTVTLTAGGGIAADTISAGTSAQLTAGTNITAATVSAGTTAQLMAGDDITANDIHAGTIIQLDAGDAIDASNLFGNKGIQFTAGGTIQLNPEISTSGYISIVSATDVTQLAGDANSGDIIITPLLTGSISGNIDLPNANSIGSIGNFIAGGSAFIDGVDGISGALSAANATLISAAGFALEGNISTPGALEINSAGGIVQPGESSVEASTVTFESGGAVSQIGRLAANTLSGGAVSSASFTGNDTISTISSFIVQDGMFTLDESGNVTILGPLVSNSVIIKSGNAMILGSVVSEFFDISSGNVTILGPLVSNVVSIISGNVTISGPLVSSVTDITSSGAITLDGGGSLDIGGPTPSTFVLTGTTAAPTLIQNGTFDVGIDGESNPPPNVALGTLFIKGPTTTSNVTVTFAPFGKGIFLAPNIDLVLNLGPQGNASGNIDVAGLSVDSGEVSAGNTQLTGTINGIDGPLAASQGKVSPTPNPQYLFNACAISSVNCQIIPVEAVPQGNPLDRFDITSRKRRRLNKNVNLPGVAARDY